MRPRLAFVLIVGCLAVSLFCQLTVAVATTYPGSLPWVDEPARPMALFTPGDDIEGALRARIAGAKASVRVQAYSFTSRPIAQALVDARGRGVDVRVIVDRSQRTAKGSEIDFLAFGGVPVRVDAQHAIAHNKIILVDGKLVVTGSFNFTRAAEASNAENVLILPDERIATLYLANWKMHADHSDPHEPPK